VKGKSAIQTENLKKMEVSIINKDVVVFIFFLFLSFIFWYLNSLEKEIESVISFPVEYINLPNERLIIEDTPDKLNLYLKGPGYSILKQKVSGKRTLLTIDISKVNYRKVTGSKAMNYFLVTSELEKSFSVQLRSGCEILLIKPDTLFFNLEKLIEK
jgi:hypothetical protein